MYSSVRNLQYQITNYKFVLHISQFFCTFALKLDYRTIIGNALTQILTYEQINRADWQRLVEKSQTGSWFQTPEAYAFYASLPDVTEPFVFGVETDGQLRAVCVGYVTQEKSRVKQIFTCRAIVNGGICCAENTTNTEIEILLTAVRNYASAKSIYIETRNFNDYSPRKEAFEKAGFAYQPHLNYHIDCSSKERMEALLSPVRKRQIRKAMLSGAVIEEARTEQEVRDWYRILAPLYRRKVKTPLFPLSFFLTFFRSGAGTYLLVKYEGKVIGGIMCPILPNRCIYEWFICGLDTAYHDQYPSVMATYAAMDYAASHHLPRFDVMGAGEPGVPYGVRDFKAEFGGSLVEHGRFLHICHPWLYRIGAWGVRMMKRYAFAASGDGVE